MSPESFAELEEKVQGRVTAAYLAGAILECSELLDSFPPGFPAELMAGPNGGPTRDLRDWLDACDRLQEHELTHERAFFCLVLLDARFATLFEMSQPNGASFLRDLEAFKDTLSYSQTADWDQRVGQVPTALDRAILPSLAKAVDRGEASFQQLAVAQRYGTKQFNKDNLTRPAYARFLPLVLEAFEKKYGHVIDEFWCSEIAAGVVRTEKGDLHLAVNDMPSTAVDLADRCEDLYRSASEHLGEREAELFRSDIYGLSTFIYAQVDAAAETEQKLTKKDFRQSEARLADLETQVTQRMERRAQRWYILGTFVGLLIAATILGVASAFAHGNWQQLFEGAIFGAAGALASVLLRMHRGALQVEATQDTHLVAAAALVRPLMGALFGSVICALLLSGLLPIDVTVKEPDRFYYLTTVAFLAGFAERWAPSLLELTGSQLTGELNQKEKPDKAES